jgi:hypothetical protein
LIISVRYPTTIVRATSSSHISLRRVKCSIQSGQGRFKSQLRNSLLLKKRK